MTHFLVYTTQNIQDSLNLDSFNIGSNLQTFVSSQTIKLNHIFSGITETNKDSCP